MEKETEIEGLARMVAEGFSSMQQYMDKKFDAVDERFETIDARFGAMDSRFDRVENRLGAVEILVKDTNRLIDTVVLPTLNEHATRLKELEMHV
ncbi:MAG: hypothetical protein JWN64_369 [Parcubacteria group bacterium]|nr:hypothetical protein [Parcubacteria group bacterium]